MGKLHRFDLGGSLEEEHRLQVLQKVRAKSQNEAACFYHDVVSNLSKVDVDNKRVLSQRTFSSDNASLGRDESFKKNRAKSFGNGRIADENTNKNIEISSLFQTFEKSTTVEEDFANEDIDTIRKPLAPIKLQFDGTYPVRRRAKNRIQSEPILDAVLDKENIPSVKQITSPSEDKVIVFSPNEHLKKMFDSNGLKFQIPQKDFYSLLFDYRCLWQEMERLQLLQNINSKNGSRD